MATKDPLDLYEPDTTSLVHAELDERLTSQVAVERIALALKDAAFAFDTDDLITITTADDLVVTDADDYARGYELLHELATLETKVTTHYGRFDKPLNYLVGVVRKLKGPQVNAITPVKQALSKKLGTWKYEQDRRDQQRREAEQRAADMAAKAAQAAKAAVLDRVADVEADPALALSFRLEAEAVRSVETHAPPVETKSTVPVVAGHTRIPWKCEFVDVKELLRAYVEGRCFLDEAAIIKALQSSLDKQASALGPKLSQAFPGTKAVPVPSAVARKK